MFCTFATSTFLIGGAWLVVGAFWPHAANSMANRRRKVRGLKIMKIPGLTQGAWIVPFASFTVRFVFSI